MHAPAYHCPACGGPSRETRGRGNCEFCGAARVPLGTPDPRHSQPCSTCLALVAQSDAFCPRCGAAQGDADPPLVEHGGLACPGCAEPMALWSLAPHLADANAGGYRGAEAQIHGCRACGGAWVDRRTLDDLIARAQAQVRDVDPSAVVRRKMVMDVEIVYRHCPRCSQRMNRRNFARYSGVVIDECRGCGTYFDAGELDGVFAFVRSGGLAMRNQRDAEEARRDQQHQAAIARVPAEGLGLAAPARSEFDILVWFLRWVGRWIRRL